MPARKALKRARFAPLVGQKLRMTGGGDNARVTLLEVGDLVPALRLDDPNRFSLLFRVPRGHQASPGIRTLHHPRIGGVELFVSPVDRTNRGIHYQAVINRSRS
jgi:hypothetical protein